MPKNICLKVCIVNVWRIDTKIWKSLFLAVRNSPQINETTFENNHLSPVTVSIQFITNTYVRLHNCLFWHLYSSTSCFIIVDNGTWTIYIYLHPIISNESIGISITTNYVLSLLFNNFKFSKQMVLTQSHVLDLWHLWISWHDSHHISWFIFTWLKPDLFDEHRGNPWHCPSVMVFTIFLVLWHVARILSSHPVVDFSEHALKVTLSMLFK